LDPTLLCLDHTGRVRYERQRVEMTADVGLMPGRQSDLHLFRLIELDSGPALRSLGFLDSVGLVGHQVGSASSVFSRSGFRLLMISL
jgi:hypothetical protein